MYNSINYKFSEYFSYFYFQFQIQLRLRADSKFLAQYILYLCIQGFNSGSGFRLLSLAQSIILYMQTPDLSTARPHGWLCNPYYI